MYRLPINPERLEEIRIQARMNAEQFAEAVGVSRVTYLSARTSRLAWLKLINWVIDFAKTKLKKDYPITFFLSNGKNPKKPAKKND